MSDTCHMGLKTPSGEVTHTLTEEVCIFHSWNTDGRYGWDMKFHKAKIKSTSELT